MELVVDDVNVAVTIVVEVQGGHGKAGPQPLGMHQQTRDILEGAIAPVPVQAVRGQFMVRLLTLG